jgi:hypothetical protein
MSAIVRGGPAGRRLERILCERINRLKGAPEMTRMIPGTAKLAPPRSARG